MKFLNIVLLAASAAALAVNTTSSQRRSRVDNEAAILARGGHFVNVFSGGRNSRNGRNRGGNQAGSAGNANAGNADTGNANNGTALIESGQTLVLKEVNGVPGNECLTFRNNGTS